MFARKTKRSTTHLKKTGNAFLYQWLTPARSFPSSSLLRARRSLAPSVSPSELPSSCPPNMCCACLFDLCRMFLCVGSWQWMARSVCASIQKIICATGPRQDILETARSRRQVFRLIHHPPPPPNSCDTSMRECQMAHGATCAAGGASVGHILERV